MIDIKKEKYAEWLETFNFDNCKLNRKEYGKFIIDYITGERSGFVLNIDGAWGSGKTEFLKRVYTELLNEKHPVIYIDAWESDFSKSPLTVVTSELLSQLEAFDLLTAKSDAIKNIKTSFGKFLKGSAVAASGFVTAKLMNDSNIGMEFANRILEVSEIDYIDKLTSEYHDQAAAIKEIRTKLSELALILKKNYNAKLPVIVLIDELDRCRPTYSIEMLEVIKHFFKTDNFVFVVATDTEQLCHSITSVYGNNFDAKQYIKRFFDRKASLCLSAPDLNCYLNALKLDFTSYHQELNLYPLIETEANLGINKYIEAVCYTYDLKIRDIDQLINKLHACLRTAITAKKDTGKQQYINILVLLVALVEYDKERPEFYTRGNNNPEINDIVLRRGKISIYFNGVINNIFEMSLRSAVLYNDSKYTNRQPSNLTYFKIEPSSLNTCESELINCIKNALKKASEPKNKYWLWEDYKRVTELAGYLS